MFKPVFIATALGLLLAADAGCKKKGEETDKPTEVAEDDGAAKKAKGVSESNEDSLISSPSSTRRTISGVSTLLPLRRDWSMRTTLRHSSRRLCDKASGRASLQRRSLW